MLLGDIYIADLEPTTDCEQSGVRPVVIISGEVVNNYTKLCIVCPLTSKLKNFLGGIRIEKNKQNGLQADSEILTIHVRSISQKRLKKRLGRISEADMHEILKKLFDLVSN